MTSLRARITMLLIAAILAVVGLATLAASRALQPPDLQTSAGPIAQQLLVLATLAQQDPRAFVAAGGRIDNAPETGQERDRLASALQAVLTGKGMLGTVHVTQGDLATMASVDLGPNGWLIVALPDVSPPDNGWIIFSIWIAVIVAGSAIVSLYAARRLSRPLELMQQLSATIGPDGTLPPIPETGPVEIRATARALNRLSEKLRQAIESRIRLVAAAGHDLRTPMTRMRLRAEFIDDDDERAKWLSDLEELDQIADSAILLAREEVSRDGHQDLRLDLMLGDIAAELVAMGQPVEVTDLAKLKVHAGPLALKRALRNLILNAATHGGGARISVTRDASNAVVTIDDDGPGIAPELLGQVSSPSSAPTLPGARPFPARAWVWPSRAKYWAVSAAGSWWKTASPAA